MQRLGANRLLVTDGGRLVGVLSRKGLMNFLALKLELGGDDDHPDVAPAEHSETTDSR